MGQGQAAFPEQVRYSGDQRCITARCFLALRRGKKKKKKETALQQLVSVFGRIGNSSGEGVVFLGYSIAK